MKKLQFEITINAPCNVVYNSIIDAQYFEEWTAPFSPTSRLKGNWEKDSLMRFLSTEENNNICGMICNVKENIPNQFLSLEYIGTINENKDIFDGKEVKEFKGGLENYTFTSIGEKTHLQIDTDSLDIHVEYFLKMWPIGLEKIKNISEDKNNKFYQ